MKIPICDSWWCKIILPNAIKIAVVTGINLMKSSQPIKGVWSFNYLILIWFFDAFYLIYFITALFYFILSQLSISIVTNFTFVHLRIKLDCTIVINVAFLVTLIPMETILNIHHFITCVHLHIGINSICPKRVFQRNRIKSLFIVDVFSLRKALCDKLRLVPIYIAFWIPLGLKYPFAINKFRTFWQWDEIPYVIVFHGLHFIIHGINSFMRVRTFYALTKINRIIFHHIDVYLMFLEKYNVAL